MQLSHTAHDEPTDAYEPPLHGYYLVSISRHRQEDTLLLVTTATFVLAKR